MNEVTLAERVMLLDRMVQDFNLEMKSHNHVMLQFRNSLNKFYQRLELLESNNIDINQCNIECITETAYNLICQIETFIEFINS
jgi:hypothetical protein